VSYNVKFIRRDVSPMSALPPKADISSFKWNVR
jgi:hypothetical protein